MSMADTSTDEPHYAPVVRELLRQFGDQIKPGRQYGIETLHDDWCACFAGGVCNCEPVCNLIEVGPPEFN